jgi:hypothetical protein
MEGIAKSFVISFLSCQQDPCAISLLGPTNTAFARQHLAETSVFLWPCTFVLRHPPIVRAVCILSLQPTGLWLVWFRSHERAVPGAIRV